MTPAPDPTPTADPAREAWVEARLAELTAEEKASLTAGADVWTTVPIERAGIPAIKVTDGPNGARGDAFSGATAACFPVGSALGATWDVELLEEIGVALAEEARSKGAQVLLGPTVNIHRTPLGGRNFECYSEDPVLTARLAAAWVHGVQSGGVGACIKHFVGNDSEFQRWTISSEIPERALREIYLLPFEHVVATEDPWAVMGAYNRVAGEHACANRRLLRDILKGEWSFPGLVVSDWGAVHDTVGSASGGCDLEMPGPARHLGAEVAAAVAAGEVDAADLDDMARRVLRTVWRSGAVAEPPSFDERSEDRPEHRELIRHAAATSMVLLKNEAATEDGAPLLPLAPTTTIALIGPNAERASIMGGGSSFVKAHHQVHPLAALRDRIGAERVLHAPGPDIARYVPAPPDDLLLPVDDSRRGFAVAFVDTDDISTEPADLDPARVFGRRTVRTPSWTWWLPPTDQPASGRWGARWTATLPAGTGGRWEVGVAAVGRSRVLVDGEVVVDNWTDPQPGELAFGWGSEEVRGTVDLTGSADRPHELVVEYQYQREGERPALRFGLAPAPEGDPIAEAAAVASRADVAVVVVGTDGEWETEGSDRVSMRLPGDQDALVAAVVAANPNTVVVLNTGSPVEMAWLADVPAVLQTWFGGQEYGDALVDVLLGDADPGGRLPTTFPVRYEDNPTVHNYPGENGEVHYGENVFVGYRHHATFGPAPLFAFGHGLSYTSFELGAPEVRTAADDPTRITVTVPVANVGDRPGTTVVQLYVRPPKGPLSRPERELRGFARCRSAPGATATVSLELDVRSFAAFDPSVPGWVAEAGTYDLLVGTASDRIHHVVPVDLPERVVVALPTPAGEA